MVGRLALGLSVGSEKGPFLALRAAGRTLRSETDSGCEGWGNSSAGERAFPTGVRQPQGAHACELRAPLGRFGFDHVAVRQEGMEPVTYFL